MLDSNAIANVSQSLETFLTNGLDGLSLAGASSVNAKVHDLQDDVSPAAGPVVAIYLFEVVEDASARNRPRVREPDGDRIRIKKAAMALLLRYLVTPIGANAGDAQKILGRVLQLLYDHPILSGNDLVPELQQHTNLALKVSLAPLTLEERARFWYAIQKPYRLCVTYEVRVVPISPEGSSRVSAVAGRDVGLGHLEGQP